MSRTALHLRSALRSLTVAIKSEWRKSRILDLANMARTVQRWDDGPRNTYFVTTNKGVFRCDPEGLHHVVDIHLYGCAIVGNRVYMGFYIDRDAVLVEGRAEATLQGRRIRFEFSKIFSEFTGDDQRTSASDYFLR